MTTTATNRPRLATDVAQLWPPQGQWTETDYFNLPDTSRIVELSEGEVFVMPPPSDLHQKVVANLYRLFYNFIARHDLGVLRFAPLAVRLWPGKIREPDLLFVAHENADKIGETVYGPPDLMVEVVSPGSRSIDRHDKFYEYAQAGIPEYWIVDPDSETVEVFVLEEGAYVLAVKAQRGEAARSTLLPGFALACEQVFT